MGIAFAHEIDLSAIRLEDNEAQFLLDWILYHGAGEQLESWLSEDDDDGKPDDVDVALLACGIYMNDVPVITEDSLTRLLLGYHVTASMNVELEDGNRELFEALGVPFPSAEQRKRRTFPNGYRRASMVEMKWLNPIGKDKKGRILETAAKEDVCSITIEYVEKEEK